eukprot:358717-Chlamydomonas_euryale.AAC.3
MDRCTAGLPLTTVPIGADTEGSARNSPWPLYFDMKNYKYVDTYAVNHVPPVSEKGVRMRRRNVTGQARQRLMGAPTKRVDGPCLTGQERP